jgi:hypothetical protein
MTKPKNPKSQKKTPPPFKLPAWHQISDGSNLSKVKTAVLHERLDFYVNDKARSAYPIQDPIHEIFRMVDEYAKRILKSPDSSEDELAYWSASQKAAIEALDLLDLAKGNIASNDGVTAVHHAMQAAQIYFAFWLERKKAETDENLDDGRELGTLAGKKKAETNEEIMKRVIEDLYKNETMFKHDYPWLVNYFQEKVALDYKPSTLLRKIKEFAPEIRKKYE